MHRSASSPTFLTPSAPSTGPLDPSGTVLAGYLWKRSRAHPQRWLRRHFRYDGHNLTYHHSASITSPPRLTLPIERIARVVASPRPLVGIGVNVFDIWFTGGELPLEVAARTRNGMEEWVTGLSRDIGARWFAAGTAAGAAGKRRATVGEGIRDSQGGSDRDSTGQRRTSGPGGTSKLAMPTLPPLPFSLDAFEPLWDTSSSTSGSIRSSKLWAVPTSTGEAKTTPPRSSSREHAPLPSLEKLNAKLPDLPLLPAKILIPPVRTAAGSRPPTAALPQTPVKENTAASKRLASSPGRKRRGMIGSHSTTDLVAIPPMPTLTRPPPPARPVNDSSRVTTPIARSTEGAPLAMAPINRFKSAEKLQALIMALHDSTEFARPDGSFSSTFDAADRLMQDLPPVPNPVLPDEPAPTAYESKQTPTTALPLSASATAAPSYSVRQSVNSRVLPPTINTSAKQPWRIRDAAGASAAPGKTTTVSAATQPADADSPDSSQTITKPDIPSPSDAAESTAASTAINPQAVAATTTTATAVAAATAIVPASPSAPSSPVPRSIYAESPLLTSLDPHFAPRAQRIAVLSKVVDIVRHGTALHQRLTREEEEGDITAATTINRRPTATATTSTTTTTTTAAAATVTNQAALTKARRKALDEYRVSVEDLGRRTRDYIRSLPADNRDADGAGGVVVGGGSGLEMTSPTAQAVDLVESVEIMLMKLAQLREVFADRV
ncbi:hypothetical protein HDU86_004908 [Geranomyces michiganensis]|nr:hypothetical protein HDU86_004908 [Geranomyces michiganensis]